MPAIDFWNNRRWRLERLFALLFILWGILSLTSAPGWTTTLPGIGLIVIGPILAFRYIRAAVRRTIWRLRNRLIVTYVFIGVVPVFLIVLLVGLGSYIIFGQVADYLITTELTRRGESLTAAADTLSQAPPAVLADRVEETGKRLLKRFPRLEILLVRGDKRFQYPAASALEPPPNPWGDYAGLVGRGGSHFEFAHLKRHGAEITMLAPLTSDTLSNVVPGMADVQFLDFGASNQVQTGPITVTRKDVSPGTDKKSKNLPVHVDKQNPDPKIHAGRYLPPKANRFDFQVDWFSSPHIPDWAKPDDDRMAILAITTRPSAVVNVLFGTGFTAEQWSLFAFLVVAGIFLVVEIGAMLIGVSLTRTVTKAVHELYEGTERVTAGDFAHRITVKGNDQLAELGQSFNSMTENLERLIVVAKEKERLESEIEIARGVQNQLFPRAAPAMKTLQLSGSCRPARMVSGDYYDFLCLPDGNVAIAIGDVAGKGIAAALLMASIQSIMRTQLTAGVRGHNGNGNSHTSGAVSRMVGELNRQLYAVTSAEKYATFCFGLYDEDQKSFTYTNAGHLPPILLHDGQPQLLEVTGTVIGAFPSMVYEERTIAMGSGDILLAYTDGIVEPENVYGEEFGSERMMDLVVKHYAEASDDIIAHIMDAVPHWTGSQELSDDMTVVLARRIE